MDELREIILEIIKKCDSKYCLYSHSGKRLGTHDSKDSAEKQEKAIMISKARKKGHKIPKKYSKNPRNA